MRYLTCLGFCLVILIGCKTETTSTEFDVNKATWSKQTNFKVDFTDQHAAIKTLGNKKELIKSILEKVESGTVTAHDYDSFEPLSKKEVQDIFNPVDTIVTIDYETGFESGEKAVQNPLNIPAVTKFRVKQEWFYNENDFSMDTKIVGVAPLETIYNADETVRGDRPLFWVFFDKVPKPNK